MITELNISSTRDSILNMVRRKVLNLSDAEDITHDVIVKLLTHEWQNKWGFIKICVKTGCVDHFRKEAKYGREYKRSIDDVDWDGCPRGHNVDMVQGVVIRPDLLIDLQNALNGLSQEMHTTFDHEFLGRGSLPRINNNTLKWRRHYLKRVLNA